MKLKFSQTGFTLIELLIVSAMMGLVATAMIYNFKEGDRQKRVNLQRDNVISAFRLAQNYTLSGKLIPPAAQAPRVKGGTRCANDNAAVSYWVEFSSSNGYFDVMAEDHCGAIMRVQRYNNVQGTRFLESNPFSLTTALDGTNTSSSFAVRFSPPFGVMGATQDSVSSSSPLPGDFAIFQNASVSFEFQDGRRTKSVTLDGISGKIE